MGSRPPPYLPRSAACAAVLVLLSTPAAAAPAACDGLPRLDARTAPGFCVGLVAARLKAPRGLAILPGGDLIVADMGGWVPGRGRIWRLARGNEAYAKTLLFDRLDRPNAVALGPDGKVYIGMAGRIARFAPEDAEPVLEDVIGGVSGIAPLPGHGRHLLPSILFDADHHLIVNVGSGSDHCEDANGVVPPGECAERTGPDAQGVLRRYVMRWPAGTVARWEVYARGLRNSMALALDARTGELWQGENGRDAIHAAMPSLKNDNELPHDELNEIVRGGDYGWPYCYDMARPSPEYPAARCRDFRSPARLLPAHAAPLGMAFYTAEQFPAQFRHSLLITYHGYRQHGHRVVALLDGGKRRPTGRSVTLVQGQRSRANSLGAPVGIAVAHDGRVYISDDQAGIVARLHYEGKAGNNGD